MNKGLREKIADTIAISLFGSMGTIRRDDALSAADRLIRELGLREEIKYPGGFSFMPTQRHRYVTDWETE